MILARFTPGARGEAARGADRDAEITDIDLNAWVAQAEAGAELGLTEFAARKRYQRAIRRLREALQEKICPPSPMRTSRVAFQQ